MSHCVFGPLVSTLSAFFQAAATNDPAMRHLAGDPEQLLLEGQFTGMNLLRAGIKSESDAKDAPFVLSECPAAYHTYEAALVFRYRSPNKDTFLLIQPKDQPDTLGLVIPPHRINCEFGALRDRLQLSC